MYSRLVLAGLLLSVPVARAEQLTFPLTVDFALLDRAVEQQLGAQSGGRATLWGTPGGCRSLALE